MKIILHLGVHKTATTHFQSRLLNSENILSSHNVSYIPLSDVRRLVTSKLFDGVPLEKKLSDMTNKKNEKVIISDENLLGGTDQLSSNSLYPNLKKRLLALLKNSQLDVDSVHITIRNPEDYLISRYCEYLRHYKFLSFFEYIDRYDVKGFSWLPLIHDIEKTVGVKVEVTAFEQLFEDESLYLKRLTGLDLNFELASEGAAIRRSKISLEAYRILEHMADHYPRPMTKKIMNMMDNNQQRSKATPFKPFSAETSKILKENYESDKIALSLI